MTKKALLRESLKSVVCPACGGVKLAHWAFCPGCYDRLPKEVRAGLRRVLSEEYQAAVFSAVELLGFGGIVVPGKHCGSGSVEESSASRPRP